MNGQCSVDQCQSTAVSRGWCNIHYQRWYKHGDPLAQCAPKYANPEAAFAANTRMNRRGCLIWTAGKSSAGYGQISVAGRTIQAHRYAWERANGSIPAGLFIDHKCHNPPCCNLDHLRLATPKQNTENMKAPRIDNRGTGVRGVRKRGKGSYEARASHHGQYIRAGTFPTLQEAEAAAIALRNRLFTHNDLDRKSTTQAATNPAAFVISGQRPATESETTP